MDTSRTPSKSEEETMREWLTSENPDKRASAEAYFNGTRGADNPEDIGYEQHGTTSTGQPIWGSDGGGPASQGGMVGSGIGSTPEEIAAHLNFLRGLSSGPIDGRARNYGQPGQPMGYGDPRRGGNIEGMDYSRSAPPPMVRPQGRNTQLPQYGTDPYMPVGQGAPTHRAQPMPPLARMAPMPPSAAQRAQDARTPAPGTQGAPSVPSYQQATQQPAGLGDPMAVAQQKALATMALGGQSTGIKRPPGY